MKWPAKKGAVDDVEWLDRLSIGLVLHNTAEAERRRFGRIARRLKRLEKPEESVEGMMRKLGTGYMVQYRPKNNYSGEGFFVWEWIDTHRQNKTFIGRWAFMPQTESRTAKAALRKALKSQQSQPRGR